MPLPNFGTPASTATVEDAQAQLPDFGPLTTGTTTAQPVRTPRLPNFGAAPRLPNFGPPLGLRPASEDFASGRLKLPPEPNPVNPQTGIAAPTQNFWSTFEGPRLPVSEPVSPSVVAPLVTTPAGTRATGAVRSAVPPVAGQAITAGLQPITGAQRLARAVSPSAGYDYLTKPIWDYLPEGLRSQLDAGQFAANVAKKNPDDAFMQNVSGVINGLGDFGKSMTQPGMIALMGAGPLPKAAQKLIAMGFAVQMASATPEIARQLGVEMGKPEDQQDKQLIARLFTTAALNTGFAAFAGAHGLKPEFSKLPDFRGMTPEQKGAYGGQQVVRALQGIPLKDEAPPRIVTDTGQPADFLQQVPERGLNMAPLAPPAPPQTPVTPPRPALPNFGQESPKQPPQAPNTPAGVPAPPEPALGTPERVQTITQRFLDELKANMTANQVKPAEKASVSQVPAAEEVSTKPAPAPATPSGQALPAVNSPHDLAPALMVDGKPLTGGSTHAEIMQNHAGDANGDAVLAAFDETGKTPETSNHVFVDKAGNVLNRVQAGAAMEPFGQPKGEPLHSQALSELQAAEPKAASPVAPGKPRPSFWLRPRSDGEPDILDAIQEEGGIKPPGPNAGGEYDGYNQYGKFLGRTGKTLFRKSGQAVDNMVSALQDRGFKKIQTPDDLWEAFDAASKGRDALRTGGGGYEAQADRFWSAATSPNSKAGLLKIRAEDLNVGDKFRLRAPGVSHEELTVTHLDADTGTITVKDGPSFGTQDLPEGSEIWVNARDVSEEVRQASLIRGWEERNAPPGETKFAAGQLREAATASNLDKLAQEVHGKSYADLEDWQQDALRKTVESGKVSRWQPSATDAGRRLAGGREPISSPSTPATTRQGGQLPDVRSLAEDVDRINSELWNARNQVRPDYVAPAPLDKLPTDKNAIRRFKIPQLERQLAEAQARLSQAQSRAERSMEALRINPRWVELQTKSDRNPNSLTFGERGELMRMREQANARFASGESDLFGAPESITDQQARIAAEKKAAAGKAAKGAIVEKAGAKLTGSDIDTTKEMFGQESRVSKSGQQSFFAKDEGKGRGITPDQTKKVSDAMEQNFKNAPKTEIHGTPDTLPDAVKRAAKQQGVNLDTVKAVYHDGKVHLVASNLDSANEAARKWLHEAAGHQGVETVLGDNANDFLDGVYQAYKDRPMMDDLRRRYANADNRTLAREVLAHLAEDPTSDPGLWQKVVARVRAALRAAGVKLSVTDADIQEILRRAVKQIGGTQEQARFAAGAEKDETRPAWISNTSAAKAVRAARIAYDKTGDRSKSIDAGLNAIVSSAPAKFDEWQARRWFSNEFGKPENFPKEASAAAFAKQKLYDEGMLDSDAADSLNRLPLSKQAVIDVESALWKSGEKRTWKELVANEGDAGHTFEGADESDSFSWAKQHHGLTDDINEAGYVLPNGEMLDFSGKRQGGEAGTRAEDHRQIQFPGRPGEGYEAMRVFMKKGAMRVDANSGNIDMETAPTDSQIRKIQEIGDQNEKLFVDLQDGNRKASISGEAAKKTIGLIRRFYRGEDLPEHQVSFAAGEQEAGFDDLKAAAEDANARRGRAYEAINKARDVSNKDVTKEMQDERRAADIEAREANEALRRHPAYIEDTITRYNEALKQLEAAKAVGDPSKLAAARAEVDSFHDEFKQMPSRTFTEVWNRMQDEGKLPKSVELPPGRSLSTLTDWLKSHKIDSPKMGIMQRLRLSDRAADAVRGVKDAINTSRLRAQAAWETMKESFLHPPVDDDFRRVIKEWGLADTHTGLETREWVKEIERKVPDPRRRSAISVYLEASGDLDELRAQRADLNGVKGGERYAPVWDAALKLTDTERALADSIRGDFETKLDDAKNVGMLDKGRENYGVPQLWKKQPVMPESAGAGSKGTAGNWRAKLDPRDPFFALQRTVPTYFDGIMHGGEPHTLDVGRLVGVYNEAFHKNLSSRAVIWNLKDAKAADGQPVVKISGDAHFVPLESGKRQLLVDSKSRGRDTVTADGRPYRSIDHWALRGWQYKGNTEAGSPVLVRGDFLVHPDHYEFLRNELMPSKLREGAVGAVMNPVFKTQAFLKASKFTLGTFHMFTIGEHMVTHLVNPFTNGFRIDLRDPQQARLVRNGLELGFGRERTAFEEGLASGHGGLWGHVPGIGDATAQLTDFLFKDYIPAIKMKVGLEVLKRNESRYNKELTPDQVAELTAHQMNAAGGMQAYRLLGKDKTLTDLNRLLLTAPDFLVSRFKVVGQALKPYGAEQRHFLIRQALVMYAGCRVLNQILDNNPHFELKNIFSVVYKGRAYTIRTIVGDMAHLFSDPMGFAQGRLSPFVRSGIETATGRDMRTGARKDTFVQWQPGRAAEIAIRDLAMWLAPIGTEGMLPGSTQREQSIVGTVAGATVGLGSRKFTAQGQMWDAATKFNRDSPDLAARLYQKERDAEAHGESAYRKLDDLLLADKTGAAQQEYSALVNEGHKPSSIAARYNASRPFTGSQARDQQMLRNQPDLMDTYQKAMQERRDLRRRFAQMPK